jgi:hypothetical protein
VKALLRRGDGENSTQLVIQWQRRPSLSPEEIDQMFACGQNIPRDFHRTAVRNLVRAAVPARVAVLLTGRRTRAVFERYNVVSPGDLREPRVASIDLSGWASAAVRGLAATYP